MYEDIMKALRFACLIYYILSISFRVLFFENYNIFLDHGTALFFDYAVDLFYLIDVIVSAPRSNAVHPHGQAFNQPQSVSKAIHRQSLVVNRNTTSQKTANRRKNTLLEAIQDNVAKYFPHFVMLFPFEIIGLLTAMRGFYVLRTIRLFRCFYFYAYWLDFADILRRYNYATTPGAQRVVVFTVTLAVVGHVAACMFYNVALNNLRDGISNNWLVVDGLAVIDDTDGTFELLESVSFRYVRAIYWSVQTLTTVGFGDLGAHSESETWFCVFYFLVVAVLVNFTLANLTMAITNFDAAYTENLKKINRFEKYAAYRKLPPALTNRVVSYYEHQWKKLRGMDELQIQAELPSRLRNQVIHHVIRDKLLIIHVFNSMNKSCLNAITKSVESFIYSPQDIIVRENSVVTGVHIISEGTLLRSHTKSTGEPMELHEEEVFGEKGLLESYTSLHTYTAKTYSELLFLPGSTFRHLCQLYLTASEIDNLISTLTQFTQENSGSRTSTKQPAFIKVNRPSIFGRKFSFVRSDAMVVRPKVKDSLLRSLFGKCMAPNSTFRMWWGALIFVGMMFYCITCGLLLQAILRQKFLAHYTPMLIVCYIIDGLFIADTVLQAACFAYDEDGVIVTEPEKILAQYWKKPSSLTNLIIVLPLDIAIGASTHFRLIPVLRLLKLGHLGRFDQCYDNVEDILFTYCGVSVSFELSRFIYLYMILFFLCHWCGCLWTLVAEVSMKIFGYNVSWRYLDSHDGFYALNYKSLSGSLPYWRELYWTVNVMSSIGWPSTLPTNAVEYIGISVLMFVGYLLFTTLVGALSSLMGSFNSTGRAFDSKVDKIRQLVKFKAVSKPIEMKIVRYYEYIWARYGGIDEAEVLGNLPKSLRSAVANHVLGPLLDRIPFFDSCSEPMEQMIVSLFETRIFLEDDALMICGEVGQDMFIIEKGEVEITSADRSMTYAKLKDGDYVGESCFLELSKRTASAYALDYVDTYFLTRDNFLKAAEKFPAEYGVVMDAIRETLRLKAEKNAGIKSAPRSRTMLETENKLREERRLARTNSEVESAAVANEGNIHPESDIKLLWDVGISMSLLYYAIMIPMRIALHLNPYLFILDYILDAVNIYDNYLCIAVFAVYAAGELLVIDPLIRAHYLKTRFWGDLLASIPYDLIALGFLHYPAQRLALIRALLRLPKLVRLRLTSTYIGQMKRLLQKFNVSSALIEVVQLTFSILMVMHWVACLFYMLAHFGWHVGSCVNEPGAYYGTACHYRHTWVGQQIATLNLPQDGGTQWYRFLKAQYWALSTTVAVTIGDMVTMSDIEVVYAFFVTFFGLCVNGMILGSVMTLVNDASEESNKVFRNMEIMQSYLVANNVPADLITRAVGQMRHLATTEGSLAVNQTAIFSELPHSIKLAIDNQVKTIPFLRRCPIFDFCSEEILRGISAKLHVQFNVKGDKIITGGELGHEMFFVESGSVNVMSLDGSVLYSTLEEGAFFGETAIFFRSVRSATVVVASPFCVCLRLSKADLEHELRAADFDPMQVINAFKVLQESNERRNKAVTKNLALAKDSKSKLFKLIKPDEPETAKKSWLHILRTNLSPSSYFRAIWDCLGAVLLLYYTLSIVFYIAFFFGPKIDLYLNFIAFDFFIDLYWVVDIVLKSYVFSFKADIMHDKAVTDGDAIWKHYKASGYFELDVIASIPFEFLALIPGTDPVFIFICRANHLLRVPQLLEYSNLVEGHLQEKGGLMLSRATWFLLRFGLLYFAVCHWLSCGYFMIHRYGERDLPRTYVTVDGAATFNEATGQHDICSFSTSFCYSRTLYFVIGTITGIGYGDIAPRTSLETFYQMVSIVVDMFMIASMHGFCAMFLEEHDAKSNDVFNNKMQTLQNYIGFRKLAKTDGDAILAQYTHMWRKVKSTKAEKNEVLSLLSQSTAMDLSLHLQAGILKMVPLLNDLALHARRRIASALTPQIAMADTYLYRAGDPGECIFFVSHGSMRVELNADLNLLDSRGITALQILLHKHTVYSDVHIAGDHFGEYCVVSHAGLRPESVKVLSGSEVYALSRADLWSIFQYLTYAERRAMIYELMTRVGERHHITKKMNPVYTVDNDLGEDTRMKALYRMAFDVMNELIDELNSIELLRSQDHDDEHHLSLKRMLRAQSANADKFSQRDLIDLFERETNANQNIRLTFSENALRSRLSSFNSHIEPIDPTESVGFESGSDRSASPRTRASSFAAVATGSNAAALRSPSISHLVMTKIPNMTGVESSQDLEVRDIESDPTSEEEDSVEGGDGFNQASHGESRRRSPSNSFVHKRVQALAAGAEKEKEKEVELRTVSPVAAVRKGSGVRFDLELEVPAAPAATPVGGAKSVILHRRSSNVDYNVVKNALEIEEMVGHRRGSTSIRGGAYMDSPL